MNITHDVQSLSIVNRSRACDRSNSTKGVSVADVPKSKVQFVNPFDNPENEALICSVCVRAKYPKKETINIMVESDFKESVLSKFMGFSDYTKMMSNKKSANSVSAYLLNQSNQSGLDRLYRELGRAVFIDIACRDRGVTTFEVLIREGHLDKLKATLGLENFSKMLSSPNTYQSFRWFLDDEMAGRLIDRIGLDNAVQLAVDSGRSSDAGCVVNDAVWDKIKTHVTPKEFVVMASEERLLEFVRFFAGL